MVIETTWGETIQLQMNPKSIRITKMSEVRLYEIYTHAVVELTLALTLIAIISRVSFKVLHRVRRQQRKSMHFTEHWLYVIHFLHSAHIRRCSRRRFEWAISRDRERD